MINGGLNMKKIIIEDDDRAVIGKWRVEKLEDFRITFESIVKKDK